MKPVGSNSVSIALPNSTIIHSVHVVLLPNKRFPHHASVVHLFTGLNKVLLSLGQFCDADMIIILTNYKLLEVMDKESQEVMLQGNQSRIDGEWCTNLSN